MIRERIIASTPDRSKRWSLNRLAGIDDLTYSSVAPGSSDEASWTMDLRADFAHPALRRGRIIEIDIDGGLVWNGFLSQAGAGADGWSLQAEGAATVLGRRLALDGGGDTTATPNTAIDRVGLPWKRPVSLSATAFGDYENTEQLNTVGDLLSAWAEAEGKRWGVDLDWNVFATTDPTTPTLHMTPGAGTVGLADDDYASHIYLRYISSSTFLPTTAPASDADVAADYGIEEEVLDATEAGIFSSADAATIAAKVLAAGKPRLAWTGSVSPASRQLTRGGIPTFLPTVRAGIMVRLHGIPDPRTGELYVDFVVGKAVYASGADSIELTPPELAARDLQAYLAETAVA